MNKIQRLQATLNGEMPDRVPANKYQSRSHQDGD